MIAGTVRFNWPCTMINRCVFSPPPSPRQTFHVTVQKEQCVRHRAHSIWTASTSYYSLYRVRRTYIGIEHRQVVVRASHRLYVKQNHRSNEPYRQIKRATSDGNDDQRRFSSTQRSQNRAQNHVRYHTSRGRVGSVPPGGWIPCRRASWRGGCMND